MILLQRYIAFIFLLLGIPVTAGTLIVSPDGPVYSVKAALEQAAAGDTILVRAGVYKEYNLLIDKPVTLMGEGLPVIDGEDQGEIIRVVADNVHIEGLLIRNVGTSYTSDHAAIRMVRCENFLIKNMVFEKLFFGIFLEKSNKGIISGNKITGDATDEYSSGNGIHLWYSHEVKVLDNSVEGVRDGIYLEFSDHILIKDNTSKGNLRYGLHFMFSNNDTYINNVFKDNGAGVAVMFSKHIKMFDNHFLKNWGTASFGLLLKEINDSEIKGNVFEQNTVGINIEGSNRVHYDSNDFISNGWAVKVLGACYTNIFTRNNFLSNSFDVSYNNSMNDNTFHGNYWSEYTGYDLNKDGVGDVPYRPVKLFSYVVNRTPETLVLLRSLFVDMIDFSEKVSPVFTPDALVDATPLIKRRK
ncbi:nitrous oxide reductase family maturation protein NosD [Robertkochia marina]|uniref:Nitrous oxide reductase family maturation protein NosD n=1 Tax=Robertkochia marina TaxID=1227945 RepID=A0A4V6RRU0_9FLAO|nr:nitrous oxide reductase family maturation protein NosD [Robertkochia marina]THD69138.1 nitrous oxide reductase family maturation protein NosD [Robertkochia marina]TRZ47603.1 nitrous oxide reductase family maturation protein NosD [Robertkochia marina]